MRSCASTLLLVFALLACSVADAAETQPYKVNLVSVGNNKIDDTLKETSDLRSLRSAPVSPFGLIARAHADMDRLKTVLESFGYYESVVTIKINGMELSAPGLGAALTVLPKGTNANVEVSFNLGTLYQLRRIDIEGEVPESINARAVLGLTTGQPAVAANVLAASARLQSTLQEQGYAFAKVPPPVAYEAADAPVLDLTFHVEAGQKVTIGEVRIEGLRRTHEQVVRRRLTLQTGDLYRPSAIDRARHDLLALNVFGQVSVQIGTEADAAGGVPVTFVIRERPRHAVSLRAEYSSDLGGSGGATWTDRNVLGNADQLSFAASVINLGGSSTTGIGYDINTKYLIPDFLQRNQSLQVTVAAIKQHLEAYDQTSKSVGFSVTRKLSNVWSISMGVTASDETISQIVSATTDANGQVVEDRETFFYTLVAVPVALSYDSTNLVAPLDDPVHGIRGSLSVTPTLAIGHPNSTFIITQLRAAAFFDLAELLSTPSGRSVLAARALLGKAQGASQLSLPPDQRFYAGGSATIRGFAYQSVGPKFPGTDNPTGGTAISAVGLEFRQRLFTTWGVAAFIDAGQTSDTLRLIPNNLQAGAGVGVRYYTPIGPLRFDVAVPINPTPGESSVQGRYQVYIGLGQAF
jgi:translocation and assembly module TamA